MLEKVAALRVAHPSLPYLEVDGGIDDTTAAAASAAGANVLISGSYLLGGSAAKLYDGFAGLERTLLEHGQ